MTGQLFASTSGTMVGTAEVHFRNGSSWGGNSTSAYHTNNTFIDGNMTLATPSYRTGTIKWLSGTILGTGVLSLVASTAMDTVGGVWPNIYVYTATVTINSRLDISNTLNIIQSAVFAGTSEFVTATLITASITAITTTFTPGIDYQVTTLLSAYQSQISSIVLFTSSSPTVKANLILKEGATCRCLASFTRIDALGGRPIRSFMGTITDCENVVRITDLVTVATIAA
jgi:hypothetical protein